MFTERRGLYHFLFLGIVFISLTTSAQNKVVVKGKLENAQLKNASLLFVGKMVAPGTLNDGELYATVKNNRFSLSLDIDETQVAFLFIETEEHLFSQPLYLSKGYDLTLQCTIQDDQLTIQTSGVGANDNQRLIVPWGHELLAIRNRTDSTPEATYQELRKLYIQDSTAIETYINKHRPSEGFIKTWRLQYQYDFVVDYYTITESRKIYTPFTYARNKAKWKKIQYDLLTRYPVVNEEAFKAKVPAYFTLIERFLNFTKDSLQDVDNISTQTFLQEWFAEERKRDGDAFRPDSYSLLKKKIIERFFNGEIKHYLYAKLFQEALSTANPINLERVYKEYAAKYPDSKNLSLFNNAMEEVFRASRNNLTTGMKFIERGDTIRTFKQLIQIVKGKTLLLDMWGTWCGPCREDIKKHSAAIKAHFKNKPVDYLYVANMDEGNEKGWKELISFFKLEGYHILATRELTKDIMANIKGSGYPSYAIIRPDGSIELSKTQFPMKREVLIQQIEEVLK